MVPFNILLHFRMRYMLKVYADLSIIYYFWFRFIYAEHVFNSCWWPKQFATCFPSRYRMYFYIMIYFAKINILWYFIVTFSALIRPCWINRNLATQTETTCIAKYYDVSIRWVFLKSAIQIALGSLHGYNNSLSVMDCQVKIFNGRYCFHYSSHRNLEVLCRWKSKFTIVARLPKL